MGLGGGVGFGEHDLVTRDGMAYGLPLKRCGNEIVEVVIERGDGDGWWFWCNLKGSRA